MLIGNVQCTGSEGSILDCSHATDQSVSVVQCDPRESAALSCQGKTIINPLLYLCMDTAHVQYHLLPSPCYHVPICSGRNIALCLPAELIV